MVHRTLGSLLIALVFMLVLSTQYFRRAPSGADVLRQRLGVLFSDFDSPDLQRMAAICLGLYFVGFTIWQRRLRRRPVTGQKLIQRRDLAPGFNLQEICLFAFVGIASFAYVDQFPESASKSEFLVLITGLTLGQGISSLRLWRKNQGRHDSIQQLMLPPFVFVLTLAAVFHPDMGKAFQYREQSRWIGPWDNPNTFGLLMGLGVTLAAGQHLKQSLFKTKFSDGDAAQSEFKSHWVSILPYLAATLVMGFGLIKSFSRGAWVATFCGLAYLVFVLKRKSVVAKSLMMSSVRSGHAEQWQLQTKWCRFLPTTAVLFFSLLIIGFWSFQHTEQPVIRRTFSLGNMNDFSWRNRVLASAGALQMMSDRPWFGFGWIQPEIVYNEYYRPAKLVEGMAIVLNDYFVLGMTLGLPALACFLIHVYSRFYSGHRSFCRGQAQLSANDLDMAICRAGFIVILVGFLPERGLFFLAMGTPFWVLLELGNDN